MPYGLFGMMLRNRRCRGARARRASRRRSACCFNATESITDSQPVHGRREWRCNPRRVRSSKPIRLCDRLAVVGLNLRVNNSSRAVPLAVKSTYARKHCGTLPRLMAYPKSLTRRDCTSYRFEKPIQICYSQYVDRRSLSFFKFFLRTLG